MANGVEIALFKNILQHHVLNTNPVYQSNNKHNNKVEEKKPFHKNKKITIKHQIYEDKNWTGDLVGGKSKYLH